jgi:hypothetical protein
MLLQEFLDLGFKITFEKLTTNYTGVLEEDERYIEIFNAYANHNEELGDKLLREYKIDFPYIWCHKFEILTKEELENE